MAPRRICTRRSTTRSRELRSRTRLASPELGLSAALRAWQRTESLVVDARDHGEHRAHRTDDFDLKWDITGGQDALLKALAELGFALEKGKANVSRLVVEDAGAV